MNLQLRKFKILKNIYLIRELVGHSERELYQDSDFKLAWNPSSATDEACASHCTTQCFGFHLYVELMGNLSQLLSEAIVEAILEVFF